MSQSQIMTGARAIVSLSKTGSGGTAPQGKQIGFFTNCTWSVTQGKTPAFILGKYNPAEITPVDQDAVRMTLSGYRIIGAGPYAIGLATELTKLMTENDTTITVVDRQTTKTIFTAVGCRVLGWSSGVAARGLSDIRFDILGLYATDETSSATDGDDNPTLFSQS